MLYENYDATSGGMAVSGSLTAADLRGNELSDDEKHILRESVKGRDGLDLEL